MVLASHRACCDSLVLMMAITRTARAGNNAAQSLHVADRRASCCWQSWGAYGNMVSAPRIYPSRQSSLPTDRLSRNKLQASFHNHAETEYGDLPHWIVST